MRKSTSKDLKRKRKKQGITTQKIRDIRSQLMTPLQVMRISFIKRQHRSIVSSPSFSDASLR